MQHGMFSCAVTDLGHSHSGENDRICMQNLGCFYKISLVLIDIEMYGLKILISHNLIYTHICIL